MHEAVCELKHLQVEISCKLVLLLTLFDQHPQLVAFTLSFWIIGVTTK